MDSICFTKTFFLAKALVPLVKFTLTIIGNILGVIPTATEKAKRIASVKLLLIIPSTKRIIRHITTMNFINILVISFIPLSNAVIFFLVFISLPILPKYVSKPVFTTMAFAVPLMTLEDIYRTFFISNKLSYSFLLVSFFSTGIDSPVKTDSLTNKSLLFTTIQSAGIMLPAFNDIISPTTTFSTFISNSLLSLITLVVDTILLLSFLLNLYAE